MDVLIAPQPTIHAHSVPHASASTADAPLHVADPSHAAALVEAHAAAESARARHAEVEALLRTLEDLTEALADIAAEPPLDTDAILERQARIDALHAEMDQVQSRLDLAILRADLADDALVQSYAHLEASVVQSNTDALSHRGMFDRMADAIEDIQNGFVRETQTAAQLFLEFFRGYADIMAKLSQAIKADTAKDKEGYVVVKFDGLRAELWSFIDHWDDRGLGTFTSRADAQRFLTDTGLIEMDFPIRQNKAGAWEIALPHHVANATRDSMPAEPWKWNNDDPPKWVEGTPISWNNAVYQAWLSGSNGRQEGLQNNSRTIVERLSRVNQIFDNLNQVLSEAKRAVDDADRQVAHNL